MQRSPTRILSWSVLVVCALIGLGSLGFVLLRHPDGIPLSADPGAPAVPVWATLLPAVAGIALTVLLPIRQPLLPVRIVERRRVRGATLALVVCALAFSTIVFVPGLATSAWYLLVKLVLLIAIPAVIVARTRPSILLDRGQGAWRWWMPAVIVLVWALLAKAAPWNPRFDLAGYDPTILILGGLVTALTAGVGEELFYRRWLQTRLEGLLGAAGIALTSLLFACMHLGSHGTGALLGDVARAVVAQGSFGVLVGMIWWRFRALWAVIVLHLIMNGWEVVAALLG